MGLDDGLKKDGLDAADKNMGAAADDLNHFDPTKDDPAEAAKKMAEKQKQMAIAAAFAIAEKNIEAAKALALSEAKAQAAKAVGAVLNQLPGGLVDVPPDIADSAIDGLGNTAADQAKNKLNEVKPAEPSI